MSSVIITKVENGRGQNKKQNHNQSADPGAGDGHNQSADRQANNPSHKLEGPHDELLKETLLEPRPNDIVSHTRIIDENDDRLTAFNQDVGQWLQEARLKAGFTLRQAATSVNFSVRQIKDIEAGKTNLVGEDFHALVASYGVAPESVNSFLEDYGLKVETSEAQTIRDQ